MDDSVCAPVADEEVAPVARARLDPGVVETDGSAARVPKK